MTPPSTLAGIAGVLRDNGAHTAQARLDTRAGAYAGAGADTNAGAGAGADAEEVFRCVYVGLGGFHVDNMLSDCDLPVVAHMGTDDAHVGAGGAHKHVHVRAVLVWGAGTGDTRELFPGVRGGSDVLLVQWEASPLTVLSLSLEDSLLLRVLDVAKALATSLGHSTLLPSNSDVLARAHTLRVSSSLSSDSGLALSRLGVGPSFVRVLRAALAPRLSLATASLGGLTLRLTVHSERLSAVYVDVDSTPVRLSGLELVRVRATLDNILKALAAHYTADAILYAPVLLGSLNMLGNPTQLVSSLASGLQDLFYLPSRYDGVLYT